MRFDLRANYADPDGKKSHVSQHLLRSLQRSNDDPFWKDDPELVIWMLHMGGSFSPKGTIRSEFKTLLQNNHASRFSGMHGSSAELIEVMKRFIWSEKAYRAQVEEFWKEIHPDGE